MPILPPPIASVLDTVNSVLTAAKVRLNDDVTTLEATGGRVLDNGTYFSQQVTNNAWRKFCEFLANIGFTALKQEAIIGPMPLVATRDPGIPSWINWFNSFDGANLWAAPVLPPDLIVPLKVWERPSGMNAMFPQQPMELWFDGLPGRPKQSWNGAWEWRASTIYLPGSMQAMDLRILYQRYLGDFLDVGSVQWFQQPVPIPRCQDALSLFICAEFAETRENMDAAGWRTKAEDAARLVVNRDVSMKQRGNIRRRSRSGRLECSGYGWY